MYNKALSISELAIQYPSKKDEIYLPHGITALVINAVLWQ
jgi:hypothetical protein